MTRGTLTQDWYNKHSKDSKDPKEILSKPSKGLNKAVGFAIGKVLRPVRSS